MEDVLTDIPPPSRFLLEDLNNFAPPSPPLPSPFLLFSTPNPNPNEPLRPSLLIIAISSPSLHFFHRLSAKTLIGTLVLPEMPFSGNSIEPSPRDKSINIYTLNGVDPSIMIVSFQYTVAAERSHAVAKLLIGDQIVPEKVLILDSVRRSNFRDFRGRISTDDTIAFKLETSSERRSSRLLKGLDYFPSGSVVDGLAGALLGRCEMEKIKGSLCVSWPEFGGSVVSLVKSVLLKDVLPGLDNVVGDNDRDEFLGFGRIKELNDSELYT